MAATYSLNISVSCFIAYHQRIRRGSAIMAYVTRGSAQPHVSSLHLCASACPAYGLNARSRAKSHDATAHRFFAHIFLWFACARHLWRAPLASFDDIVAAMNVWRSEESCDVVAS